MTKGEAVRLLIEMARAEVGYKERGVNENKYAEFLDVFDTFYIPINGYAWCAIFAIWCYVISLGYDTAKRVVNFDSHSCSCHWWKQQLFYNGQNVDAPEVGDIWFNTVITHTGIVSKVNFPDGTVTIIAGNTEDSVKEYNVPINGAIFCRPNWSELENVQTIGQTIQESNETEEAKAWAIDNKIFIGDQEGDFRWDNSLARKEAAIILKRLYDLLK